MKTLLLLTILSLWQIQGICQWTTAERIYSDSEGIYLIQYEYNQRMCMRTLMWWDGEGEDPNMTSYDATIIVYRFFGNDTIMIGESFEGSYSPDGYFSDNPAEWIKKAKELELNPTPKTENIIYLDLDSITWYSFTDTVYFYDLKGEWIEVEPHKWYNEAIKEWRDSTQAYGALKLLAKEWQSYKQEYNDSTWITIDVYSVVSEYDVTFKERYVIYRQEDDIYWLHKTKSVEEFLDRLLEKYLP